MPACLFFLYLHAIPNANNNSEGNVQMAQSESDLIHLERKW